MPSFIELIIYGSLAGLFFAIIGALKDYPYEGFHISAFLRGILIGAISGVVVYVFLLFFPQTLITIPWLYILTCGGLERQLSESYKNYVRVESQEKYRIPGYATILGHIIKNHMQRILLGAVFLTIFLRFYCG